MKKLSSDVLIYINTFVFVVLSYFLIVNSLNTEYLEDKYLTVIFLLLFVSYLGYKAFKYRSVKYDKDNLYIADIIGGRKDIIPFELVSSITYTRHYSGNILEHRIKYIKNSVRQSILTNIELSALDDLISFLEEENPKVAEIFKK